MTEQLTSAGVGGNTEPHRLKARLGTPGVVFLVLAFAAPLAASVSNIPLAFSLSQGDGIPGVWLCCAIVLALFSFGYVEMSRHVTDAGAFSAYVRLALGSRAGASAGYVAVVAYSSGVILITAFFGFFASVELDSLFGVSVEWYLCGLVGLVFALALSVLGVSGSVSILMVLLAIESVFLVVWNVGVLSDVGIGAYPVSSFAPTHVFSGAVGGIFAFAFSTFLGFEATAIYGEESKRPKQVVRRATYLSLAIITVLYTLTAWSLVAAVQSPAHRDLAADPGTLFTALTHDILGKFAADTLGVLLVTSLFAVMLASLNSAARYLFSLARAGTLPQRIATVHPRFGSPTAALVVQAAATVIVVVVYAAAGADPFAQLGATFVGLSALGVIVLECALSVAVVVFFRRNPGKSSANPFITLVAPILSALGLAAAAVAVVENFSLISGSGAGFISYLPLVLLLAAGLGAVVGAPRAMKVDVAQS